VIKFGHYTDKGLPNHKDNSVYTIQNGYKTNSHGYRCPEWDPMPEGKKNVVVLGCSHTFGEGLGEEEHWVAHLSKYNTQRLRYWNLALPGASADLIFRILQGTEQIINPNIIIVCWPAWSRRERLLNFNNKPMHQINITSGDPLLKFENEDTDQQNFLKNVFLVEKYAEQNQCKTLHCFAQESYQEHIKGLNVLEEYTIKNCWPYWDKFEQRVPYNEPSLARDGKHYGVEHHERFAKIFVDYFGKKLR
jgi:hypothetical protein